jgi:hypothetical protein
VVSPGISWEFNETGTSVTLWFLRREETQIRLWILILLLLYLVIICQKESKYMQVQKVSKHIMECDLK